MRTLFADTSYWIALLNPDDGLNKKARVFSEKSAQFRIVTTEMVLVEFLTHVSKWGEHVRKLAVDVVQDLRARPDVEIVPQTTEQFQAALETYASRLDKRSSLTDCASFNLMSGMKIWEALTSDRDFEQARFIALLKD